MESTDKFEGFELAAYQPKRFLYQGRAYNWCDLSRAQVVMLGNDPKFNAITPKSEVHNEGEDVVDEEQPSPATEQPSKAPRKRNPKKEA
jgi:hypothetical protein